MKTESILARVNGILAMSEDPTPTRQELQKLAEELAENVRHEIAVSRGVGNAAATIQRMLKRCRKKEPARTALHYAWIDSTGRQCVCDGYRAFRLNDPLPTEPRPDEAGNGVDLDSIMSGIDVATRDVLPIPSAQTLKSHIAIERAAKHPLVWDFGPGRPVVDATYLLDVITVLPDAAQVFVRRGSKGIVAPIYARGERGDAFLCPVRSKDYIDRESQADALQMLSDYTEQIERDALHSMSLDDFAALAQVVYQVKA